MRETISADDASRDGGGQSHKPHGNGACLVITRYVNHGGKDTLWATNEPDKLTTTRSHFLRQIPVLHAVVGAGAQSK